MRPALAAFRRRLRKHTPLPGGPVPALPPEAEEHDTAIGTLWFDRDDAYMTPWIRDQGVWEADVMKLLARWLRPGSLYVDVGANVGYHALFAAKLGARVVAIEPVPWTLELLRANVWRHGADVEIVEAAASDSEGTAHIALDPDHRSGAQMAAEGLVVPTFPLDVLVPEGAVDVLKIDVEGAEPMVLRGAQWRSSSAARCSPQSSSSATSRMPAASHPRRCSSSTSRLASSSPCSTETATSTPSRRRP